ncbi:MAG: hypothetical protein M1814_000246 [Vezdaea aestivalis]|nr:MAG: hypothetical protein M1814_000246 [Vezdaea aestivalis]
MEPHFQAERLNEVLARLSQTSVLPQNIAVSSGPQTPPNYGPGYMPSSQPSTAQAFTTSTFQRPRGAVEVYPKLGTPPLGVDPKTILDWPSAVQHVVKLLGRNDHLKDRVRKDPERDNEELKRYDNKVFLKLGEMSKAFSAELQQLGVPFFGVPDHLIDSARQPNTFNRPEPQPSLRSKTITIEELMSLQRKMLAFLEDMTLEEAK